VQKILSAPGNSVESDQHDGELLSPRISHLEIKTRAPCLPSTNTTIFVFVHDFESSLGRQLSKIVQL